MCGALILELSYREVVSLSNLLAGRQGDSYGGDDSYNVRTLRHYLPSLVSSSEAYQWHRIPAAAVETTTRTAQVIPATTRMAQGTTTPRATTTAPATPRATITAALAAREEAPTALAAAGAITTAPQTAQISTARATLGATVTDLEAV